MEMLSKMETNITNNIDPYAYRLAELRSEQGHLIIATRTTLSSRTQLIRQTNGVLLLLPMS